MTTKRAFVPAALHAELTEYTNLVRVLRTTRALDLTAHLLRHAAQQQKEKQKESDTWTSWPLIDCPVPEWTLEDEIHQLGETVVQALSAQNACDNDGDSSGPDSGSDQALSPAAAKHLVLHTGAVLVHILNLLVDQRPSVPGSMQNRLWTMNWEDVISALAVSGVVDPTIVARAEKRLECIYGPSSTKAMERLESATSAKTRCASLTAVAEDQLFAIPVLSRPHRSDAKGCRREGGFKSRSTVDTDTDTDERL